MARFRTTISGERGEASRQGHREITSHTRGWDVGVCVCGFRDGDKDVFKIYATGGSNHATSEVLIGEVRLSDDGMPVFNPTAENKSTNVPVVLTGQGDYQKTWPKERKL